MNRTTSSKPADGERKRTEVFISATSGDLRSVREIVKQGLLTMGCHPVEQANFAPDYRTVRQMLESRIAECDAVIHIAGRRYGAEPDPATLPEGAPRRSYTQMEADIARRLGKKLYVFLCPHEFPYDEEPDEESAEKRSLQQAYREHLAGQQSLHTPVGNREDIARKVRELQFDLEKLQESIHRHRARTFALLAVLALILAALAGGVWWWAARTPQATAARVVTLLQYDRQRTREALSQEIRSQAEKKLVALDRVKDWRAVVEIEKERDQQLADLDRFLNGIEQTTAKGEASESYLTATKLLQGNGKGIGEALAFLEARGSQRAALIEAQRNRRDHEEKDLRKLLQEELLAASLLEKQARFQEAEEKYRQIIREANAWAEPRNALARILIERGEVIEPKEGNAKLKEAVEICQGTITMNPKSEAPRDWAAAQDSLGYAFLELSGRSAGVEEALRQLGEAVTAFHRALEVYTKTGIPLDWAGTQNNLGNALENLGTRSVGEEGSHQLREAVTAYRSVLEVVPKGELQWGVTQNNLGIALQQLGARSGGNEGIRLLSEAVAAYRGALEVFPRAGQPQRWAGAQTNLGATLLVLGTQSVGETGTRHFAESAAASRNALEVYTRAGFPQQWALTQSNLGGALMELGARIREKEGHRQLVESVAAFRRALEVRTRTDVPQDWAATQDNLISALWRLAEREKGGESLACWEEALKLKREIVSEQPGDSARLQLASGLGDFAFKLVLNRQFQKAEAACEEAQREADKIGGAVTSEQRVNLIAIQQNLAHALLFQGRYDEALAIYRKNWRKPLGGKTFGACTLEDFAEFETEALTHPDLARAKAALKKLTL